MIQLNEQERKFLQALGRRPDGQRFAAILERAKNEMSSIDSIESNANDYGAQVEGRKLFCSFAEQIIKEIKTKRHDTRPLEIDDYT